MTCTANAHTTCYGLIDIVAWSRPTGTRRTWASRRGAGDGAAPIPSVAVRGPHSPVQLDEVGRERQVQPAGEGGRHEAAGGAGLPEALAEGSVELAQAMVPLASALARKGG